MSPTLKLYHGKHLEPPAREAVAVLARFAAQMTGQALPATAALATPHALVLGEAPDLAPGALAAKIQHDGYALVPGPQGLAFLANNAKGLLNAVYGYLRWCGVRWPAPGVEVLPQAGKLPQLKEAILRNPTYPRRGIFHSAHGDWEQIAEFYARLGFNDIGVHGTPASWKDMMKTARRFGLELQIGGHGLAALLPREEFAKHPEYFRALQPPDFDRTRLPDSNLCSGNAGALDIVRKGAAKYVRQYPGATAYHLWADDLPAGGWCFCAPCMGLTPQDQAVRANNAVAEGVCRADPKAKTAHLIYHDTIEPPRIVKPHPGLAPLYAPRERCYAHALNDPACARNRYFTKHLEAVLEYFGHRDWLLFEYYSDYILFRGMLPLTPEIIAEDLKYYYSLGLRNAQHLYVGSGVGLLLNMHVFAELAWDLESDPWQALKRLSQGHPALLKAWRAQAKASLRWLDISDCPVDRYFDYRFLIERKPAAAAKYLKGLAQASAEMEAAAAALPKGLPAWAQEEAWSLRASAAICRQMIAQTEMLQASAATLGGKDEVARAKAAKQETVRRAKDIAKVFAKAGKEHVYFHSLEPMMEKIWEEKMAGLRAPERC